MTLEKVKTELAGVIGVHSLDLITTEQLDDGKWSVVLQIHDKSYTATEEQASTAAMKVVGEALRAAVEYHADFPKAGVTFQHLGSILADAALARMLVTLAAHRVRVAGLVPDLVVGPESRGFLLFAVAVELGVGFAMARKSKLPGELATIEYGTEYSRDRISVEKARLASRRVLIVDDLVATGGSMAALGQLSVQCGASVLGFLAFLHVPDLLPVAVAKLPPAAPLLLIIP